jgi:hypothetical protein
MEAPEFVTILVVNVVDGKRDEQVLPSAGPNIDTESLSLYISGIFLVLLLE